MVLRTLPCLILTALCVPLAGCWSTPAPTISVVSMTPGDSTPDGSLLILELQAQSTAEDQLPLTEVRYTVSLDGKQVFSGFRSPQATLRRFGSQRLVLPAVVPVGAAIGGAYEVEGTLTYVEPGTIAGVLLDFGVRTPSVDFSGTGVLAARAAPITTPLTPPGR